LSDREKAQAWCCLQSLSEFEHHGVELRQHAHTTCSLPGCLSTGQSSAGKDPAAACPSPSPRGLLQNMPSCAVMRASRAHRIARALSLSLPPCRMTRRPSITLRITAMWRRWSSSWPTAPTRRPKTRYAHHSKLIGWRKKGEREEGCSAAQARKCRPHKPCARRDAHNHMKLEK